MDQDLESKASKAGVPSRNLETRTRLENKKEGISLWIFNPHAVLAIYPLNRYKMIEAIFGQAESRFQRDKSKVYEAGSYPEACRGELHLDMILSFQFL